MVSLFTSVRFSALPVTVPIPGAAPLAASPGAARAALIKAVVLVFLASSDLRKTGGRKHSSMYTEIDSEVILY